MPYTAAAAKLTKAGKKLQTAKWNKTKNVSIKHADINTTTRHTITTKMRSPAVSEIADHTAYNIWYNCLLISSFKPKSTSDAFKLF